MFVTLLITFTVSLVFLEGIFWFGSAARWFILIGTLLGSVISVAVALIIHNRIRRGRMSGSSDEEIAEFFETHRGLNKSQHLHEAPYWNESQSAFLKNAIIEDAAWAEVIDQLNAELHE